MPRKVAIVGTDYPGYERFCPNWVGMLEGLDTLGIERALFTCRPALDIEALVEYCPDLVVYGLIDMVKREDWRREIRQRLPHARIVLWYGDYRDRATGQITADLGELECMFVSNDAQAEWYERIWRVRKCLYLPLGSKIYPEIINPRFAFDFVFIGGKMTGRRFVDRAIEIGRFQKEGLRVVNGPAHRPDLREKVFAAMPAIYRSSKISLDQSHFTDVLRYTSNRHWIIPASGGFALTKRFPGCELDYPEGTRAYYDSFDEAIDKMRYYLAHPDEREEIRLAGRVHAAQHTYDHRFRRMFQYLYG
jgi:hypothetical protein